MVGVVAAAMVLGMVVLVVMMFSTDEKTLCWWTINLLPTEQLAGFNPSSMAFGDQPRPSPMFSEEGRTSQGQAGLFSMGPQKEMASFFDQLPTGGGIIESNNVSKFHCKCSLTSPNILWHVRMYERICLHIGESLLTSLFTFFLISIRLNSQKPWPYIRNKCESRKSW